MSNKKQKAQDHIPIQDMNGNFVAFGHPGFLRKLAKVERGFFQKSIMTLQTSFVLSKPLTPGNYPELIPFIKDNKVNENQPETLPVEQKEKWFYGDLPDTVSTNTFSTHTVLSVNPQVIKDSVFEAMKESRKVTDEINGVEFGVDEAIPGADQTVLVGYGPSKEQKVFSEAEQKAYFSEFNARHRHLQNINVEVLKSNMGETKYIINADYRGDITVYQYFKCHIRCELTLAEYSDNLVFKDSVWKSIHLEKWLGDYHADYSEWEDVPDKGQEDVDNRAVHSENRKELEVNWQQFYHDLPLEAINAMMNFDPRGLTDKTYSSK